MGFAITVMGIVACIIFMLNYYSNLYAIQGVLKKSDFLFFYLKHGMQTNIFLIVIGIAFLLYVSITLFFRNMNVLLRTLQGEQKEKIPFYFHFLPEFQQAKEKVEAMIQKRNETQMLSIQEKEHKNDLLMYLAHDLKTPLTSMIGYINHILDHKVDVEQLDTSIQIAYEKAKRLDDLIDEFSEILKYDDKTSQLELGKISLSSILSQQLAGFYPLMEKRGIKLEVNIPEQIDIVGDYDKLLRVFDNLMRNAITYSIEQTSIEIMGKNEGEMVVLTYKNEGDAIDPKVVHHLFDKFYRASTARTSSSGGAGLGLAIAKEIIELHHGCITAESDGNTIMFTIQLPKEQEAFL